MKILAYAAGADLYCPACAVFEYPGCDKPARDYKEVLDREGNPVTPIFETSSDASLEYCCQCGEELDPPPWEVKDQVKKLIKDGYLEFHTATELIEHAQELKQEHEDDTEQEAYADTIASIRNWLRRPLNVMLESAYRLTGVDGDGVKDELNMVAKGMGLGDVMSLNANDLQRVVESYAKEFFGED